MPCVTYSDTELRAMEGESALREVARLRAEVNQLTAWLCEIGQNVKHGQVDDYWQAPPDLLAWWDHHERLDKIAGRPLKESLLKGG